MTAVVALADVTIRSLLGRRRILLMGLLAGSPLLLAVLVRLGGGRPDASAVLDNLVLRTVLPLVALVVGTSTLGSEIDDGTLIFQLVKPIARWRVAITKALVAALTTTLLIVPPMLLTGLVLGRGDQVVTTLSGYTLSAVAGGSAYAVAFTALGALTRRALVIGLGYTLIWEGVLAGILEGTRYLSVRQAMLGIVATLTGEGPERTPLAPPVAWAIIAVVVVVGLALASLALRRFQVRAPD
jgi:ABC-2 type transport system permease protein